MKVIYDHFFPLDMNILEEMPISENARSNISQILNFISDYNQQNYVKRLTFIGDWGTYAEASNMFYTLLQSRLMRRINIIQEYNGLEILDNYTIEKTHSSNETFSRYKLDENAPLNGLVYTINTPSFKDQIDDTTLNEVTDKEVNPAITISVLDFINKFPRIYNIIENILFSLSDEYTTAY